jgi:hypothetical protein
MLLTELSVKFNIFSTINFKAVYNITPRPLVFNNYARCLSVLEIITLYTQTVDLVDFSNNLGAACPYLPRKTCIYEILIKTSLDLISR